MRKESVITIGLGMAAIALGGLTIVGGFSNRTRAEILTSQSGRCAGCGKPGKLQIHHIVPISKGGKDAAPNGVGLCRECHQFWDNQIQFGMIYPGERLSQAKSHQRYPRGRRRRGR